MLIGLWTEQYDQIMSWYSSKPQSGIAQDLYSATYCCVILPHFPCYSSSRHIYHTSSSAHLGVPRLRPSSSAYHTRSFSRLGVFRIRPIIPNSHTATPPPSISYCMMLSQNHLLLLASHEIPSKVTRSCFYVASWCHQASHLHPPHLYPFSPSHTYNSGCNATHCSTVDFCLTI